MSKALKTLAVFVALIAAAAGWFFLAPRPLGGPVSYVVTDGVSMQPALHSDDLVILRDQPTYEVGDIAGFDSESLGRVVLHRIVDELPDGRLVLRGDNNDFVDVDHPRESDLLGAKWAVVPRGGKALTWVGDPLNAGLLAGATVLLLVGGVWAPGNRRRRRRAKHNAPRRSRDDSMPRQPFTTLVAIAALIAIVSALVGVAGWTRPERDRVIDDVGYAMKGTFSYSGTVDKSPAYQDGLITTGDPLFLKVVDEVRFRFDYEVEAGTPPSQVRSDGDMVVTLSDQTGWRYEQKIDTEATSSDEGGWIEGVVDVAKISTILTRFSRITEIQQAAYTLSIHPSIDVDGDIEGSSFEQNFAPKLDFALDPLRARIALPEGDPALEAAPDPLHPVVSGTVQVPREVPGAITVGPLRLPVAQAQILSIAGAVLALLLALIGWRGRRMTNEVEAISRRYGSRLLDTSSATAPIEQRTVGVKRIDELVRVADRGDKFVLHEQESGIHTYSVADEGIVFWYQVLEPEAAREVETARVVPRRLHPVTDHRSEVEKAL